MKTITIGLADDHHLFVKGMVALLNDFEDFQVLHEAENGKILLNQLDEKQVDVVLLDIKMPIMDGWQTLEVIQHRWPDTKVIFLTMYREEYLIYKGMEAGVNGFLQKDAHPDEVETTIRSVYQHGYYFNEKLIRIMQQGISRNKRQHQNVPLTPREQEVLQLICQEKSSPEIAEQLNLSIRTIEGHREKLLAKTGAKNTAGLVVFAARVGWLEQWLPV